MGFRVIPVEDQCEALKLFFRCKRRKRSNLTSFILEEALEAENEIINLLLDYEEPISAYLPGLS